MPEYKYEAAGKTYFQKPLVLGQIKQLILALGSIELPVSGAAGAAGIDAAQLLALLGDRLPQILAVVLIEEGRFIEGRSPKDKDIDTLAAEIESAFDIETTIRVVEDFFDCNPAVSILERLTGVMEMVAKSIRPPGSTRSASSSAGETSPDATPSSGVLQ